VDRLAERVTSCAEFFHSVRSCMNGAGSVAYSTSPPGLGSGYGKSGSHPGRKRVGGFMCWVDADERDPRLQLHHEISPG